MLVLGRKMGQAILIKFGDKTVRVCPVLLREGKVRLGIEADKDVLILREEVATDEQLRRPE